MLSASKSGSASGASGYNLTRSLRLRASASAYLNRTPSVAGNRKTWTLSAWVKRGKLGSYQDILSAGLGTGGGSDETFLRFAFTSSDQLYISGNQNVWLTTNAVYRDPSAWYHIVLAFDATQSTATNRILFYVNGVQVTSFATNNLAAYVSNQNYAVNNTVPQVIGIESGPSAPPSGTFYLDGYLTEVNFVDGQALTPSSFGSTNALTGVWQPARYTGTYGTNGFYLPFTDNSALTTSSNVGLGKDFSGNGNYWTTNNISITAGVTYDSMTDVPTLTSATASNFAVLNPLDYGQAGTSLVISNGNLQAVSDRTAASNWTQSTITLPTTGKWYCEMIATAGCAVGLLDITTPNQNSAPTKYRIYYGSNGNKISDNGGSVAYGLSFTNTDTIGIAVDMGAGTLVFYKNNSSQGTAYTDISSVGVTWALGCSFSGLTNNTVIVNFGQQPFTYTPPTGFVSLNTYNLPTSTIVKGNTVMDATLYTGNGATGRLIANAAGFKPDLVWIKARSFAYNNNLYDSNRGAPLELSSNLTSAEASGDLTAFNTTGFTVNQTASFNINESGITYVGWQWQAGQGSTSSNTNGTITSTVSVNASAGFSVVTYTGTGAAATVGHGLGVAPSLIIVKNRTNAYSWSVYLASLGNTQYLFLNSTNAAASDVGQWNNTTPTSSVFSIGTSNNTGASATNYVAYCWTPIAGFSAFGSYTGNGSSDGTFVYTGFRPKFVMVKRTDNVGDWWMYDTSRSTFNTAVLVLYANTSAAEISDSNVDMLSNGFKFRTASTQPNTSGGTFIYMAYAENPFKNALAR